MKCMYSVDNIVAYVAIYGTKMVSCVQITSHTNSAILAFIYHALIKGAPWDHINFRFNFRTEVVHPTDHVIFFRIFIFL